MKAIFAVLILICAASAIRNWVGVPEKHLKKLDNLLKDTKHVTSGIRFGSKVAFGNLLKGAAKYSAKQNDHHEEDGSGEGSGVSPTQKPENSISNLVNVIHSILPDLDELREASEKQASAFAKEFVGALKNERDDNKVKALFGKHVRLLFKSCNDKMLEFAKKANESDLFKQIRHDFGSIMGEVVTKAEGGASFIEEFFKAVGKHNLWGHPVMKVLVAIGGLVGDAACDLELDGFMKAIGSEMEEHEAENVEEDEGSGKDLRCRKAKLVLLVIKTCSAAKRALNESPEKSVMQRAKRLLFQEGCTFQEALCVTDTLDIIKDLINLHIKFGALAYKANLRKKEMIVKMKSLYVKGEEEKADIMLANYVLEEMRKGMLVGFFLFQKHERDEPRETTLENKATDNHRLKM